MEQPRSPALAPPRRAGAIDDDKTSKNRRKPPSPEEMLAFYESKGLDRHAASLKAIEDLQTLLLRGANSSRRDHVAPAPDVQRKLDNVNTRLAILDMKLDSKPGYPASLAIGLASGAMFRGLAATLPPVLRAFGDMWRAVASASASQTPP